MGSGFTTLEPNMLDNGKATVIGEYSMSSNERRVSTWFNLIKLTGAVTSGSGGNASNHTEQGNTSNHAELFNNQSINARRCDCGKKGKKDKSKCKCRRK